MKLGPLGWSLLGLGLLVAGVDGVAHELGHLTYDLRVLDAASDARLTELGRVRRPGGSGTDLHADLALLLQPTSELLQRPDRVLTPLAPLLLATLSRALGPVLATNLALFAGWLGAGLATGALSRRLGADQVGAAAAALFMILGPWTVATHRSGSLDQTLVLWAPLALYATVRAASGDGWRWVLGAASGWLLTGLTSWYSLVSGLALAPLVVAALSRPQWRPLLATSGLSALVLAPMLRVQLAGLSGLADGGLDPALVWEPGRPHATVLDALAALGPGHALTLLLILLGLLTSPGPPGIRRTPLALGMGAVLGLLAAGTAATVALPLRLIGPMWRATDPDRLGLIGALGCALLIGWVIRQSPGAPRRGPLLLSVLLGGLLSHAAVSGERRALLGSPATAPKAVFDLATETAAHGASIVLLPPTPEARLPLTLALESATGVGVHRIYERGVTRLLTSAHTMGTAPTGCHQILAHQAAVSPSLHVGLALSPLPEAPGWWKGPTPTCGRP